MKLIYSLLMLCAFASCSKKVKWDASQTFYVEGYLMQSDENPIVNRAIAISQQYGVYSLSDPSSSTDSNGYFKIYYTPSGKKEGLTLHHVLKDYSCVTTELAIARNLTKGENVNVGRIYAY